MPHPACCAPPPTTNINVATTLPPYYLPPSTIDPSSPLVPPASPLKFPSSHPIISLKTKRSLKTIVGRCPKNARRSRQPSSSRLTYRHLAGGGASGIEVALEGWALLRGVIHSFQYVHCFRFGLRPPFLPFCFRSVSCASLFVCSIKYHLAPSRKADITGYYRKNNRQLSGPLSLFRTSRASCILLSSVEPTSEPRVQMLQDPCVLIFHLLK